MNKQTMNKWTMNGNFLGLLAITVRLLNPVTIPNPVISPPVIYKITKIERLSIFLNKYKKWKKKKWIAVTYD